LGRKPSTTPTVKDVAQRAAVSVGTVSRVLNDRQGVDPALRGRVESAIRDLGYHPFVRNFVRGDAERNQSRVIGLMLCNGAAIHSLHAHLLLGIEDYCSESGYYTLFARYNYDAATAPGFLELPDLLLRRDFVNCVIVAGANHENFLSALKEREVRYVLLGNHMLGSQPAEGRGNQVRYDDHRGFYEATSYLTQLGHQHIWYIDDRSRPWFRGRYEGYAKALIDKNLETHSHTLSLADDPFENSHAAITYIIEQKYPMTAVLCGSEELAAGAKEALRQHGRDVPRDVSLIGFDHRPAQARFSNVTSICVDAVEVGRQLARMAVTRIESFGKDQPEVVIPASLIKRSTCRPLRRDDVMVL
jgi:LacI family transcriptional regulator